MLIKCWRKGVNKSSTFRKYGIFSHVVQYRLPNGLQSYVSVLFHSDIFAFFPWWRHQTETFSASLSICAGNSPVPGEFPAHRPVTRGFDVVFDLRLNKRLSKQSWGSWFKTPSCPLWRHSSATSCSFEDTGWCVTDTVTWVLKCIKSLATPLLIQQLVHDHKEHI